MDSNKIKNLAFGARDALRAEVAARIGAVLEPDSAERLDQPDKTRQLEAAIKDRGMDSVVESTAYTWFNRLCALRFMDAKGYTPVPVVTPRPGATQPAILADAAQGVFDPDFGFSRLVRDRVQSVLAGGSGSGANRTEAAYGELLVAVCDRYAQAMPYLFGEAAASSLVMPQGLLAEGSILSRIVRDMDDEECETVEVLGWLYQFYVAERKAEFFGSKKKAGPKDIAPATQLFTPSWIVKYLVENSLGRLWMLNNPGSSLAEKMDYYIVPEDETEDYTKVYSPEELTLCDPACGSGHILVYAFDVLYEIYLDEGYLPEDIPSLILQNNLFGMEIDGRAAEIAKFALEMKAREKDPSFFDKHIDANVTVLETIKFEPDALADAGQIASATELLDAFEHMTEVGSLYVPAPDDMVAVDNAIANMNDNELLGSRTIEKLRTVRDVLGALSRKVSCVVANPPYMGIKKMNPWMVGWLKEKRKDSKSDLCFAFLDCYLEKAPSRTYVAMITKDGWLTSDRTKQFRKNYIESVQLNSLIQLGPRAFESLAGEVASTAAAVSCKVAPLLPTCYFDLSGYNFDQKRKYFSELLKKGVHITRRTSEFQCFPESAMAFSASDSVARAYSLDHLNRYMTSFQGIITGDNDSYLRLWYEIAICDLKLNQSDPSVLETLRAYLPYAKGGTFNRWFGNNNYVLLWENDGRDYVRSRTENRSYFFREGISWSDLCTGLISVRYQPNGFLFDGKGPMAFPEGSVTVYELLAYMNSSVFQAFLGVNGKGLDYGNGVILNQPHLQPCSEDSNRIQTLAEDCISAAKCDWDAFETSWDFVWHPLAPSAHERAEQLSYSMNSNARIASVSLISERFERWSDECDDRFNQLRANEEELNRIFSRIYSMEGEVPIEVSDDKVSVRRADLARDVKSLVSYGVGCIMGRYSTFAPGLILADAQQTVDDFKAKVPDAGFLPDDDAIIPVLDGEWFGDDIVAQFRKWLEVTYGAETLDENVRFIESALGKDLRRYFVKDFYKDHCATYQVTGSGKRPIYWMFASPKGNFQVLVYMHRYTPSTVGQILTKYLREYIEKLNAKIGQLDQSDRAADNRQADKYRAAVHELTDWERTVIYPLANERVDIDLDDGVRKNYNKFPRALAKVAGLSEWK